MPPEPDEPFESTRMSLGEHLTELRKRLFRGVLGLVIAFLVGWGFYQPISEVLLKPLLDTTRKIDESQVEKYEKLLADEQAKDPGVRRTRYFRTEDPADHHLWPQYTIETRPITTGVGEGFLFSMRVALAFGLAAGGPILLYQLWQFIAAGLYPKERRLVLAYFPFSVLLFVAGVCFGWFYLLPFCIEQLMKAFPYEMIGAQLKLEEYWNFFVTLTLALGGVFQLPLIMFALVHVDLIQRKTMAKYRGHFVLFAFVFGGIITPPDPWSQFIVAVPMILLYEIGLLATIPIARRRAREEKAGGTA